MQNIWTQALTGLQPRLGARTFDLWLRPIELDRVEGQTLRLRAPSHFMKEWFENHYLTAVLDELRRHHPGDFSIQVEVAPPAPPTEPTSPSTDRAPSPPYGEVERSSGALPRDVAPRVAESDASPSSMGGSPSPGACPRSSPFASEGTAPRPTFSPRYRFSTFIKGGPNELAASAAWSVAQEPGRRFNPLFIYGGVGLGKTHLLHAVGHALLETHGGLRILYLSAEQFMNEFITAVRFNQFDGFRKRYRESCDVLLMDDIQFIAGRDRTMDEFFHLFNVLYEAGKQIMVTADRVPADMAGMEERLTSRLNWGLVTDIKAPDLETRVAILRQKADDDGIVLPESVSIYIGNKINSNVRELEGALVRVSSFAALKGVPITDDFAREILGEPASDTSGSPLSVDAIQKIVAGYFSLRIADLKGPRRHKGVSRPRMIAMYLSRELTQASFPEIGLRFGGKDHSTVINACRRIEELSATDDDLRGVLDTLRKRMAAPTRHTA